MTRSYLNAACVGRECSVTVSNRCGRYLLNVARHGFDCQYTILHSLPKAERHHLARKRPELAPAIHPSVVLERTAGTKHTPYEPQGFPIGDRSRVPEQVNRLIQSTGQYLDDVTSQYFNGVHLWLPIISRRHFHSTLIGATFSSAPEFSILLLSIFMISDQLNQNNQLPALDTLFISTKMLLAQAQIFNSASLHLIQAGILCAVAEYAQCRADSACITIRTCINMAFAARFDQSRPPSGCQDAELDAGFQEKRNVWWALVTLERYL